MAIYYFKQGEELYRSGGIKASEGALLLLTKSIHLSPEGEFIPEARALRLVAEALSEPESSPTRETRLARALALVPGHQRATRELDRLHSHQRSKLLMAGGVGGSIAICLVLGLSFFWRRMS